MLSNYCITSNLHYKKKKEKFAGAVKNEAKMTLLEAQARHSYYQQRIKEN